MSQSRTSSSQTSSSNSSVTSVIESKYDVSPNNDRALLLTKAYVEKIKPLSMQGYQNALAKKPFVQDKKLVTAISQLCLSQAFTLDDMHQVIAPWLLQQSNCKSALAAYLVAYCHQHEYGLSKKMKEIVYWYERSMTWGKAEGNDIWKKADAMVLDIKRKVGYRLPEGANPTANSSSLNHTVAEIRQMTLDADNGEIVSQYTLGVLKSHRKDLDDTPGAIKYITLAAEQGHVKAQCFLSECYYRGIGVKKDIDKAVTLLREAANFGYSEAYYQLYIACRDGWLGQKEIEKAMGFLKRAAEQDYYPAVSALAEHYEKGDGINKNETTAMLLRGWLKRNSDKANGTSSPFPNSEYKSAPPKSDSPSSDELVRNLKIKFNDALERNTFDLEAFAKLYKLQPGCFSESYYLNFIEHYFKSNENTDQYKKLFEEICAKVNEKNLSEILVQAFVMYLNKEDKVNAEQIFQRIGNIDFRVDTSKKTALMFAAEQGFIKAIGELVDKQATLTLQSSDGKTAFDYAIEAKVYGTAAYLVIMHFDEARLKGQLMTDSKLMTLSSGKEIYARLYLYLAAMVVCKDQLKNHMLVCLPIILASFKQLGSIHSITKNGLDITFSYKKLQSRKNIALDEIRSILEKLSELKTLNEEDVKNAVVEHVVRIEEDAKKTLERAQEMKALDDTCQKLTRKISERISEAKSYSVDSTLLNKASELLSQSPSIGENSTQSTMSEFKGSAEKYKASANELLSALKKAIQKKVIQLKQEWKALDNARQALVAQLTEALSEAVLQPISLKVSGNVPGLLRKISKKPEFPSVLTPSIVSEYKDAVEKYKVSGNELRDRLYQAIEEAREKKLITSLIQTRDPIAWKNDIQKIREERKFEKDKAPCTQESKMSASAVCKYAFFAGSAFDFLNKPNVPPSTQESKMSVSAVCGSGNTFFAGSAFNFPDKSDVPLTKTGELHEKFSPSPNMACFALFMSPLSSGSWAKYVAPFDPRFKPSEWPEVSLNAPSTTTKKP